MVFNVHHTLRDETVCIANLLPASNYNN
jgi:hypothetical protein